MVNILIPGSTGISVINESGDISPALNNIIIFLLSEGEEVENKFFAAVILSARFPVGLGSKKLRLLIFALKSDPMVSLVKPFTLIVLYTPVHDCANPINGGKQVSASFFAA